MCFYRRSIVCITRFEKDYGILQYTFRAAGKMIFCMNSIINPIMYFCTNTDFQEEVGKISITKKGLDWSHLEHHKVTLEGLTCKPSSVWLEHSFLNIDLTTATTTTSGNTTIKNDAYYWKWYKYKHLHSCHTWRTDYYKNTKSDEHESHIYTYKAYIYKA